MRRIPKIPKNQRSDSPERSRRNSKSDTDDRFALVQIVQLSKLLSPFEAILFIIKGRIWMYTEPEPVYKGGSRSRKSGGSDFQLFLTNLWKGQRRPFSKNSALKMRTLFARQKLQKKLPHFLGDSFINPGIIINSVYRACRSSSRWPSVTGRCRRRGLRRPQRPRRVGFFSSSRVGSGPAFSRYNQGLQVQSRSPGIIKVSKYCDGRYCVFFRYCLATKVCRKFTCLPPVSRATS